MPRSAQFSRRRSHIIILLLNILLILESLQVEVNGQLQKYFHHLVKVPYDAKVTLKCISPTAKLLTFINTTLDLDNNLLNGLSPYLFVYSNMTIDHFNVKNRGFYSCATNITTKSLERTLITTSESQYVFLAFSTEYYTSNTIQLRIVYVYDQLGACSGQSVLVSVSKHS